VIASVRGEVTAVGPDGAVVEVGGVGIAVVCTPGTLATLRPGSPARLATSLVVREDSLTLFGFATDDERGLFELLQSASGVGPRLAMAVLGVLAPDTVRVAIAGADTATLTRVPGIGKKGAERLVLELRDKVGVVAATVPPAGAEPRPEALVGWRSQVRDGLVGLGWSPRDAEEATHAVAADLPDDGAAPELKVMLRRAIQLLGRG
jgi:Holliday junction DNA helicase RuvA